MVMHEVGEIGPRPCGVCDGVKTWCGSRFLCRPCQVRRNRERLARLSEEQRNTERLHANSLRKARRATWTPEQREAANTQVAMWRETHREQHRAGSRASYLRRADQIKDGKAAEYAADPTPFIARAKRRKALALGAVCQHGPACVTADFLTELYAASCMYCGADAAEADHFIPLARGGLHCQENIVPACLPCNRSKYDHDPVAWMASRR